MANKKKINKKKQKSMTPVIVVILIVIAVLCIGYFLVNGMGPSNKVADQDKLFGVSNDSSAAIILNGEQLEEQGIVVDDKVYISYDVVWDYINSGFYLEDNVLYLTTPSGTLSWTQDDGTGALYQNAEEMYLSADCIKENSDIDLGVYADPYRVVIRNNWDGVQNAEVLEDAEVRVRSDERSDIEVKVSQGEILTLVEAGNDWMQVITADGHDGYIKADCVSQPQEVTHEADPAYIFDSLKYEDTIRMVWHYIDSIENNQYLDGMLAETKSINIISPTWFVLSGTDGSITSYADQEYADKAHNDYGLSIWGMINDYTGEDSTTGQILMNTESRTRCIDQLMEQALTYGLEGINIDFETISWEEAPAYLQFLRELTIRAHENGIIVSVDNYVPTYTQQYKRSEQNRIVDYVIIMGYDEHTAGSEEIGSVASIGFVEDGITATLTEVDADKTVLAVPFYTRGWTEPFGSTEFESENLDMTQQQDFIDAHGIEIYWNDSVGQNMGSAEGDDARYSIWVEDAQSIDLKLQLINKYELAGASAWRVGTETADIWDVWENDLNS